MTKLDFIYMNLQLFIANLISLTNTSIPSLKQSNT